MTKKEYNKKWAEKNKEKTKECLKRYKEKNKDTISKYHKEYYEKNKEECLKRTEEYDKSHPTRRKKYNKKYWKENKERIYKYKKHRRQTDLNYRIRELLRSRLWRALKDQSAEKHEDILKLTGCSLEQLKIHIESLFTEGMSWENYGEWHMDHALPCASFDLTKTEDQKKCFHFTNLQPLWEADNKSKGHSILSNL
jgi:hypothetical protein